MMDNCIFCKIVAGEIPSVKIWEDEDFVAVLDILPACKGQTLVLPKRHLSPDIFVLWEEDYSSLLLAAKKVVALLKTWLQVERIWMVIEWIEVDHAHVKLYPFWEGKSFVGWFSGKEMVNAEELQKVADEVLGK
jgi:diadenosine tetraphosphate (Ap4A) HIT family hydrolase